MIKEYSELQDPEYLPLKSRVQNRMPLQGTFPLIWLLGLFGMQAHIWVKMDLFFKTVEYLPVLLGSANHPKCLTLAV